MSWQPLPWREITGFLLVLTAAAGLWLLGDHLETGQPLLFACLLVVVLLVVLHRLWHFLLGPLFFYDLVRTARLNRLIPLRCLFAVALLGTMLYLYAEWFGLDWTDWRAYFEPRTLGRESPEKFAHAFFFLVLGGQFVAVLLLTPAVTAGVIAEERERRTIDFLFTTALTDREIVIGCLASRLATTGLLILTAVPFLSLLQFLGGISPQILIAGLVATLVTLFSVGSLSMLISVQSRRAHTATFTTYIIVFFLAVVSSCFGSIHEAEIALTAYSLIYGSLGCACLVVAVCQLRGMPAELERVRWPPPESLPAAPVMAALTSGRRARPPVSEPPMLWKEFHVEHRLSPTLNVLCVLLGAVFVCVAFFSLIEEPESGVAGWGAFITCVVLLLVPFCAAGAVCREREQQTLEVLLATPLEKDDILFAKLLGSLYPTRWAWPILAYGWLLALIPGKIHPLAFVLQAAAWMVFAFFLASLGLLFSTLFRSTLRSTLFTAVFSMAILGVTTTTTYVSASGLANATPDNSFDQWLSRFESFGLAPGRALYVLAFTYKDLDNSRSGTVNNLVAALAGILSYGVAALVLWQLTRWLFRRQTSALASGRFPAG